MQHQLVASGSIQWTISGAFYIPVGIGNAQALSGGGDVNTRIPYYAAGTFSRLQVYVGLANGGSCVVTFQKNGAAGNQAISVSTGATGVFEDASNTDAISSGDLVNIRINATRGSGDYFVNLVGVVWEPDSGSVVRLFMFPIGSFSTNSVTRYTQVAGLPALASNESNVVQKVPVAATLRNAAVYVASNGRSTNCVLTLRKSTSGTPGDSALVVTIAGGATGLIENTTDEDTVSADETLDWKLTTGGGGGTIDVSCVSFEFVPSGSATAWIAGDAGNEVISQNQTRFAPVLGRLILRTTNVGVVTARAPGTLSNLRLYITANTLTVTLTVRLLVDGANGNQVLSISSGATGWLEDTTNTDVLDGGEVLEMSYVAPAGSGSATMWTTVMKFAAPGGTTLIAQERSLFRGVFSRIGGRVN